MEKVSGFNKHIWDSSLLFDKAQETIVRAKYTISGKPLDFSFLKLTNVEQLRKEVPRDNGKRKPIAESDEEEDMKKVSYSFFVCAIVKKWWN